MLAEVDRLRARLLPAPVAPPPPRGPAGAAFVGRVVSSSNGLTAGKFVRVNPWRSLTGTESGGAAGTVDVDTSASELVYLLRGTVATGDDLVCHHVPHRWVATRKTPATTSVGNFNFTVNGCRQAGHPKSGVVVGLYSDSARTILVGTGTSDAAGQCSIPYPSLGTWYWKATSPDSRYAIGVGSQSTFAPGNIAITVNLAAATGYVCCSAFCDDPLPGTLFLTDSNGTHTLPWNGSQWAVSYGLTVTGSPAVSYNLCSSIASVTGTVFWTIACPDSSGLWQVTLQYTTCSSSNGPSFSTGPALSWSMVANKAGANGCSTPVSIALDEHVDFTNYVAGSSLEIGPAITVSS